MSTAKYPDCTIYVSRIAEKSLSIQVAVVRTLAYILRKLKASRTPHVL